MFDRRMFRILRGVSRRYGNASGKSRQAARNQRLSSRFRLADSGGQERTRKRELTGFCVPPELIHALSELLKKKIFFLSSPFGFARHVLLELCCPNPPPPPGMAYLTGPDRPARIIYLGPAFLSNGTRFGPVDVLPRITLVLSASEKQAQDRRRAIVRRSPKIGTGIFGVIDPWTANLRFQNRPSCKSLCPSGQTLRRFVE